MTDPYEETKNFLKHYGVLGMHWGIRKPRSEAEIGQRRSKGQLSDHDKAVLAAAGANAATEDRLNNMYGPKSKGLSDTEKKLLIAAGIVGFAGAAVGVGLAVKSGKVSAAEDLLKKAAEDAESSDIEKLVASQNASKIAEREKLRVAYKKANPAPPASFTEFLEKQKTTKEINTKGFSKEFIDSLDATPINLDKGSIVKRVSTEAESEIRPDGFFAAYKPEDVDRYKAVLPVYWKQWGYSAKEGHVVSLEAQEEIKAPSPKETFDIYKQTLDDPITIFNVPKAPSFDEASDKEIDDYLEAVQHPTTKVVTMREALQAIYPDAKDDDELARLSYPNQSLYWNTNDNEATVNMFKRLKTAGYNAVLDVNDAGSIGDTPLRMIDGKAFKIVGTEPLTKQDISLAQEKILQLHHSMIGLGIFMTTILGGEHILSHTSNLTVAKRKELAAKGEAMPDGSFPITNVSDLEDAIRTYGLSNNKTAAKAWIIKRATELDATDKLPDGWVSVTHSDIDIRDFLQHHGILEFEELNEVENKLEHFGVLGMHWGVRKPTADASPKEKRHINNTRKKLAVGTVGLAALGGIAAVRYKNNSDQRKFNKLAPILRKKVAKVSVVDINPDSVKIGKSVLESLGKIATTDA